MGPWTVTVRAPAGRSSDVDAGPAGCRAGSIVQLALPAVTVKAGANGAAS